MPVNQLHCFPLISEETISKKTPDIMMLWVASPGQIGDRVGFSHPTLPCASVFPEDPSATPTIQRCCHMSSSAPLSLKELDWAVSYPCVTPLFQHWHSRSNTKSDVKLSWSHISSTYKIKNSNCSTSNKQLRSSSDSDKMTTLWGMTIFTISLFIKSFW